MRYPLFSEIAHNNDPVLDAYETANLKGDVNINPLDAAIVAFVNKNGGDPNSTEVQIAVRDRLIGALIPQIVNLWNYFKDASRESEYHKKLFEEKMNEVANLRAKATINELSHKYRLKGGMAGGVGDDSGGDDGG